MAVDGLRFALTGRYAIDREIGRGGMATVYLATDLHVSRQVAIKVLHPELAAALGGERFHREIEIASHLTHPNILPVHDSGEADGTLFYVMPFVEGESLRSRLDRERQLPIDEAIRITCQIASALDYAHQSNIVHRDIKPENILIEAGQAVLADFGIARAVTSSADAETLTRTGMSLGTPAYMSPEQAMAERALDGRSDQYALACVTYEMLTGQPPFTAPTQRALVARQINEQVPLITTVRPSVPEDVQDVILQALEKVPADRFATIGEFASALAEAGEMTMTATRRRVSASRAMRTARTTGAARRPARSMSRRRQAIFGGLVVVALAGSAAAGVRAWQRAPEVTLQGAIADGLDARRIAVLYFDDLSRDRSLAHAADGLTEGLIAELSRVRGLKVVSSRGVAPYRNADIPRDSIARALGVGTLIDGSIEPVASQVRVAARLIDGNTGDVRRARFEVPARQLVAGPDSLVEAVARLLRQHVGEDVRLQERRASTSSTVAWTLAQRAQRLRKEAEASAATGDRDRATRGFSEADSMLAAAEAADPKWLEAIIARGSLALSRLRLARVADDALPWLEAASGHAERALERAPRNPEALSLRGQARYRLWTLRLNPDRAAQDTLLQRARRDLEAAVTADPAQARANVVLSYLYYQLEDVPGALLAARRAYEEDAYLEAAAQILYRLFWGSLDLEQLSEARRWCSEGVRRFPEDYRFAECQLRLMATPAVPAEADQAWRLLARLDSLTPAQRRAFAVAEGHILVAGALARAGLVDSARTVLRSTRRRIASETDPNQDLAAIEAYVRTLTNEHDLAIDLLKRYVAANPGHGFEARSGTAWWYRELRTHPRWREVAQPSR